MGEDSSSDSEDERGRARMQRAQLKQRASQTRNDDAGDDLLERRLEQEELGQQLKAQEDLQRLAQQARMMTRMKAQASFVRTRLAARISKSRASAASSTDEKVVVIAARAGVIAAPGMLGSDEVEAGGKNPERDADALPNEPPQGTPRSKLKSGAFALTEEDKIELVTKQQQRIAADEKRRAQELEEAVRLKSEAMEKEESLRRSTSSALKKAEDEARARQEAETAKAEEIRQLLAAQEDGLLQAGSDSAVRRADMISKTTSDRAELAKVRAEKEAVQAEREEVRQAAARKKRKEEDEESARRKAASEEEERRLRALAEEADRHEQDRAAEEAERREAEELSEAVKRQEFERKECERKECVKLQRMQGKKRDHDEKVRELWLDSAADGRCQEEGLHLENRRRMDRGSADQTVFCAQERQAEQHQTKVSHTESIHLEHDAGTFRALGVIEVEEVIKTHTEDEAESGKPELPISGKVNVGPIVDCQSRPGSDTVHEQAKAEGVIQHEVEYAAEDPADAEKSNIGTQAANVEPVAEVGVAGPEKADIIMVKGGPAGKLRSMQTVVLNPQEADTIPKLDERSRDEENRLAEQGRATEEAQKGRRLVAAARVQAAKNEKRLERECLRLEQVRLEAEIASLRKSTEAEAAGLEETSRTARVLMAAREALGEEEVREQHGPVDPEKHRLLWGSHQVSPRQQLHILKHRLGACGGRVQIQGIGGVRWTGTGAEVANNTGRGRSRQSGRSRKEGEEKVRRPGAQSMSPRRHVPDFRKRWGDRHGDGGEKTDMMNKHESSPYASIPAILSQGRQSQRFKRLVEMHKKAETVVVEASDIAAPHRRSQRLVESMALPSLDSFGDQTKTVIRLAPKKNRTRVGSALGTDRTRISGGREEGMLDDHVSPEATAKLPALARGRAGA